MNDFQYPLTLVQFLIPTIGTGVILGGVSLYSYMAARYRSGLYLSMTMLAVFAFGFVGSEAMILGFGAFLHNKSVAVHFHQSEQLAGAFFLFGLPWFLSQILHLGDKWRKLNDIIAVAGLVYALVCVFSVFLSSDWFISSTVPKSTWLLNEADYGRGQEGTLYLIRDGLLALVILYSIICIAVDLVRTKRVAYLLFPLAGLVFAVLGAGIDIGFVYTGVNFDFFPHEYFSRFSLGITLFVLCLLSGLTRHFIDVAREVEYAHRLITISEEKYRVLIEGTNDLVFTLDERMTFLSANGMTIRQLGLSEKELRSRSLIEMMYFESIVSEVEEQSILDKIAELRKKRKPVQIHAMLRGKEDKEPKDYQIRLEYINIEGKNEIIGRAEELPENTLSRHLENEYQKYIIGNYLITADEISKRLVANLGKYLPANDITMLRIGLREIIINAIEHGNLNISFDEKSEATMNDSYMEFIASRQNDPEYKNRTVTIKFSLSPTKVVYVIEDQGQGFDHSNFSERANEEELAHGRGISMASSIFDIIRYNDKGNKVTLVRKLGNVPVINEDDMFSDFS